MKIKNDYNSALDYCDICFFDHGLKTIATYDIIIKEWNKGECFDSCSINCNIIHKDPIEKKHHFCRKHYLEFKRYEKEIDVKL
jgi:hypothetical protein|tara:strand:- start:351 stop:599 length:249 start_codon:yes stop_codon:yes gene_type:complete